MCLLHCRRTRDLSHGSRLGLWLVVLAVLVFTGLAPVRAGVAAPASAPLPAPIPPWPRQPWPNPIQVYEASVTLPTFPYERYQSDAYDPQYNWHYKRFDYERFRAEAPQPEPRIYQTIVLENQYLRLIVLPELGGRLWRVIDKSTGNDIFYHNPVVMPSPWGPADMGGWFALGGLEWDLPVAEHGYAWGTSWDVTALQRNGQQAAITLALPRAGQSLEASIKISLAADEAAFVVAPTITNVSDKPVRFAFWHSAALAPGKNNSPSAETRFIIPSENVAIHSTDDSALPGFGHTVPWPWDNGRDLSRLGNLDQYLGFFEWPAAHGPFVAVYDPLQDAGVVRVFPNASVRGSKVFALGWQHPLDTSYYTTDGSSYVELHGGLAPTFADQVALAAGESVQWSETWYGVHGIGGVTQANEYGAFTWQRSGDYLDVGFYPTRRVSGDMIVLAGDRPVADLPFAAQPDAPFVTRLSLYENGGVPPGASLTVQVQDKAGVPLLAVK
jgi:hypothetical protein